MIVLRSTILRPVVVAFVEEKNDFRLKMALLGYTHFIYL